MVSLVSVWNELRVKLALCRLLSWECYRDVRKLSVGSVRFLLTHSSHACLYWCYLRDASAVLR